MPVTPTYSLPYELGNASPNGAAQGQALALAVEAALTALAAKVPRVVEGESTSDLTLGTSIGDVPGATVTFSLAATSVVLIQCSYDMTTEATTTGFAICKFAVDGVTNGKNLPMRAIGAGPAVDRRGGAIQKRTTLAAGSHTVKLQGDKQINDGTVKLSGTVEVTIFG